MEAPREEGYEVVRAAELGLGAVMQRERAYLRGRCGAPHTPVTLLGDGLAILF